MKPYSQDLRERVLRDCDAGIEIRQVALKYSVSESWIRRLKQRRRETGELLPRRAGSPKPPQWLPHLEQLQQIVAEKPDATLEELRDALGVTFSISTLSRALRALQLTFKKKFSTRRSKTGLTSKSDGRSGNRK